jgi:hypothetical protein
MFQVSRILFPVDSSERCRGAAAYVEALVGRFDADGADLIMIPTQGMGIYRRLILGSTSRRCG